MPRKIITKKPKNKKKQTVKEKESDEHIQDNNDQDENDEDYQDDEEDNQIQEEEDNLKNQIPYEFYKILEVQEKAPIEEIKKSYRKLAQKLHPDKNKDNSEQQKDVFMQIVKAYSILSDAEKKKKYDINGIYDEGFSSEQFDQAYEYFRSLYKKIEVKDIEDFQKKYVGSQEEIEDLINFYNQNKGDITLILENIMLSKNEDIERFVKIYDDLISEKKIKSTKLYEKSKNNIKKLKVVSKKQEKEILDSFKKLQNSIIQQNKSKTNSFLSDLEQKYGNQQKKSQPKKQFVEQPPEDNEEEDKKTLKKKKK